MNSRNDQKAKITPSDPIQCAMCIHFSYFDNGAGHNSPHALGKCDVQSWDGNRGQWAMFRHQCKNIVKGASRQGKNENGAK